MGVESRRVRCNLRIASSSWNEMIATPTAHSQKTIFAAEITGEWLRATGAGLGWICTADAGCGRRAGAGDEAGIATSPVRSGDGNCSGGGMGTQAGTVTFQCGSTAIPAAPERIATTAVASTRWRQEADLRRSSPVVASAPPSIKVDFQDASQRRLLIGPPFRHE